VEVKTALDKHILKEHPIKYLFSEAAPFNPTCSGIWAEFGVAGGESPDPKIATQLRLLAFLHVMG